MRGGPASGGVCVHAGIRRSSHPFASGQIAVDKFGRNTVRSSIIVDYDSSAITQVVAPLFAAKTEHLYPIPSASSNMRNMQVCVAR
jgi:hypothetical protein